LIAVVQICTTAINLNFMKLKIIQIICIAIFSIVSYNAKSQYVFHRLYNYNNFYDFGQSVIQTSDNGYITVGNSLYNFDGTYIIKTDEKGDTLWSKFYDFSLMGGDEGNTVFQLNDNNYLIGGWFYDTTESSRDSYLLKLNPSGEIVWFKLVDVGHNDQIIMLKQINDNAFIMGGYLYNSTNTNTNVFLVKTDNLGNIQWQQEYGAADKNDYLKSIDLTADGGFIIGGDYENTTTNSFDMFLLKTDSLGNQQWKKYYGTNYSERKGYAISTLDGGYAIVGYTTYANGDVDGYIVKTNSSGTKIWEKKYGLTTSPDVFKVIRQLPDSTYIVGGSIQDVNYDPAMPHVRLFKLNQLGDTIWTKKYGYYGFNGPYADISDTYLEDLNLTTDGGFIATGYIINNSLPAKNDLWLLKTCTINTSTYEGCWSFNCGTISSQITTDSDTVYITQGATLQFGTISNFGTGWQWNFGDTITSTEQFPQHSYTSTGIKTVQLITNNDYCSDTAYYTITVLLDVGINSTFYIENSTFDILPNPASEKLTVSGNQLSVIGNQFIVYDLFGKEVLTRELKTEKQLIDISALKQGIYYYKIVNNGELTDGGKLVIVK